MFIRKCSTKKMLSAAILTLLAAHVSTVWAQDQSGPGHNRRPHPPTTRPPEITDGMRLGTSPPPFEKHLAVQAPFEVAGRNIPEAAPPVQAPAPQTKPVIKTRPAPKPQPVQVAKAVIPEEPPVEKVAPVIPEEPKAPESMPGYIVFVAGIMLLFRKSKKD